MDYPAIKNLPAMFFERAAQYGDREFLWAKRDGAWAPLSWNETAARVGALARGLEGLGISPGDRVGLVAENCPEWLIADVAIMAAGAITVPAYVTNTVDDHLHILSNSGAKAVIVSTAALAKLVLPAAAQSTETEIAITMEPVEHAPAQDLRVTAWDDVLAEGGDGADDVAARAAEIPRADTACIIYTSGTSGLPKGVMLSHGAILSNCMGAHEFLEMLPGFATGAEVFLSFLPLSHSYEHTAGQFLPIAIGAQIYYAEGVDKLTGNMEEAMPTILTAVPRLYEAMHGRITRGVEQTGGLKKTLFMKTVELGRKRYEAGGTLGWWDGLVDGLLERLVREKVRARFGGRLKAFVSGGAPLNYDIGVFFQALGLRILQGYGQTEAAPVVSCNHPGLNKLATVGPPMKGVEVKIASDGEILVRGELVMRGYWNDDQATAETIVDGWLHTGDIGVIDEDGYIRITDRKKDIIVTSGGDNISPQRVEGMLTIEPEIAQAMVYGDTRPHLVALVVPDSEFALGWAKGKGKPEDMAALAEDEEFGRVIRGAIDRVNAKLSNIERIRHFTMAPDGFTIENEMLTPSMKIRRHIINRHFGDKLQALYGN